MCVHVYVCVCETVCVCVYAFMLHVSKSELVCSCASVCVFWPYYVFVGAWFFLAWLHVGMCMCVYVRA